MAASLTQEKSATPAQLALSWLLFRAESIVPIFGTRKRANLASNLDAAGLALGPSDLAAIDEGAPPGAVGGDRWAPDLMAQLDG